jgi:16S rRNA processing protein RimM
LTRDRRICIARIGAAHGVRGDVRLWTFTEQPKAVQDYGPLETADGSRRFIITGLRAAKDCLVASIEGVVTRDQAEALNGTELYVARAQLPAPAEDEFYHADLIGLRASDPSGTPLGTVIAVQNFGAGDLLEIQPPDQGGTVMVPFKPNIVPTVDVAGGRIVIDPPQDLFERE